MKKIIIAIVAVVAMSTVASAQISTLGVRGAFGSGAGAELSAQWGLGGNRLETDLGWVGGPNWSYINLSGIYQWTGEISGPFGWFAGIGANLGLYGGNNADYNGFGLGLAAQAGLEFNFSFPLQLTLDVRPSWGFIGHSGFGWGAALGVRYRF
ncbi:MAG: hypothetical protein K5650_03825 [Bacteroidales bacterium]|nr:hypothetical protein [Bacteroidales bacterium]